jgi:hypothetical protein
MSIARQRKITPPPCISHRARTAFRTLHGWALGTLVDQGAVIECADHGHRLDRADPDAWTRAREKAWRNPFPSATSEACIAEMDAIRDGLGDTCPDC